MNYKITRAYEETVLSVTNSLKKYSHTISIVFGVIGSIILGSWGYKAGNIGGAILFTIAGFFFGGMIGFQMPNSIVEALGTVKRLIILASSLGIAILMTYIFNSIPLGLTLFIATWLYLYYLSRQTSS